jgi:hypothetical protein
MKPVMTEVVMDKLVLLRISVVRIIGVVWFYRICIDLADTVSANIEILAKKRPYFEFGANY